MAILLTLFDTIVVKPFYGLKTKILNYYDDSRMHTPVLTSNQNGGFLAPYPPKDSATRSYGVSFSSEESDLSSNQTLATPLRINFSDEEDEFSPSHPRRSKRNVKNQKWVEKF